METIKVKFTDLPSEVDPQDNYLTKLLEKHYILDFSDDPDFVFYAAFGYDYQNYDDRVRIFIGGEPLFANFNDCDYAMGHANMSFGDQYLEIGPILASPREQGIPQSIQDRSHISDNLFDRKFCNFVYSNDIPEGAWALRKAFCQKVMDEYKHVDCPGKVLNNMPEGSIAKRWEDDKEGKKTVKDDIGWVNGKIDFLSDYKFTIAFENAMIPGYTTEKLVDPFLANSIPIYWGNPDVTKYYNPKAFINCNEYNNDFDAVLARIKELDNDKEQYMAMLREPPLQADFPFDMVDRLEKWLCHIIELGPKPRDKNPAHFVPVACPKQFEFVFNEYCSRGEKLKLYENSNIVRLMWKLKKFGDSKWGKIPKKVYHMYLKKNKAEEDNKEMNTNINKLILSVIIPTYNMEEQLPVCLNSIKSQGIKQFEVVVVNDHSTDGTTRFLKNFCARNNWCRMIEPETGKGVSNARNIGLKAAKGEYVHFVDADDTIPSGAYKACLEKVSQDHPELLTAFYTFENSTDKRTVYFQGKTALAFNLNNNNLSLCNRWIKREWLINQGLLLDVNRKTAEDANFILEVLRRKPSLSVLEQSIYEYHYDDLDDERHFERDLSIDALNNSLHVITNNFAMPLDCSKEEGALWANAYLCYLDFIYFNVWKKMYNFEEKEEGFYQIKKALEIVQKNNPICNLMLTENEYHFRDSYECDYSTFQLLDYSQYMTMCTFNRTLREKTMPAAAALPSVSGQFVVNCANGKVGMHTIIQAGKQWLKYKIKKLRHKV